MEKFINPINLNENQDFGADYEDVNPDYKSLMLSKNETQHKFWEQIKVFLENPDYVNQTFKSKFDWFLVGYFDVEFKIKNFFNVESKNNEPISGITIQIANINSFDIDDDFESKTWKLLIEEIKLTKNGPFGMECFWCDNIELV